MIGLLRAAVLSLGVVILTTAADAAGPAYKLRVAGLACPFCAYGIEKKLGALEGVESAETHIRDGTVIVTMKDGTSLGKAVAKRAVEAAGFTLDGFEEVETNGAPKQE